MTANGFTKRRAMALIGSVLVAATVITIAVSARPGSNAPRVRCVSARIVAFASRLASPCGPLLGVATDPNTLSRLLRVQTLLGRRVDMTYRFHDLNDAIPTPEELAVVRSGRLLHISIDARIRGKTERRVPWSKVAAGAYDATLRAQAEGIASLNAPVFVTFDHEPDQPAHAVQGRPAQFIAAWRHVHQLFESAGAHNVIWVWVVTGQPGAAAFAARFWPGNAYVDWISWEAYSPNGCRTGSPDVRHVRSFAESALPFYQWLQSHGAQAGIDIHKPMMISEAGSALFGAGVEAAAEWYGQMASVLEAHPQIQAIGLWDRPGIDRCRYGFDQHPRIVQALAQALHSSPFAVRP